MQNPGFKYEYFSKTIRYKDFNIETYVIGSGKNAVLSFPSFPHSGLYYLWFLNHYDLSKIKFYTLDLPGWIGYSDNIFRDKPFDINEYMNVIKTLIKEYGLKKFSVLGYSYGSALTVKLTSELPEMIDRIVLASPFINANIVKTTTEVRGVNLIKALGFNKFFDLYLRNIWREYKPQILNDGFPEGLLTVYENMIKHANSKILLDSIYTLFHSDLTSCLNSIENKDLLIINSRDETKMFRKQAEQLRRRFSNGKSIFVSGRHEDFILRPKSDVVKKVVDFLTND